ncbi:MAG: alanine--glyoxylate aminotransferase family protein [Eubacteriales bacterium]|nr:alanine--glyoxylate aminotransferase family protein [Eubacteriales bacterium]
MYKIMSAGPSEVRENVRMARSLPCTNPDFDPDFYTFYHQTCGKLERILHSDRHQALILGGEGILGLEAACASLTEPGDRVLVIDNGIFGKGFADFVRIYGGTPVLFHSDYHRAVDPEELRAFLENDHAFKYATVVHCDTPSGVLNDIEAISCLLDQFGIMTVADSVAASFGIPLDLSNSKIDILCGGSQKALSVPPGLTLLWVSRRAYETMENRKTPIAAFYANILNFRHYYENQWFPYTMPVSDINGLAQAVDNFLEDPDVFKRHKNIAEAVRTAVRKSGLSLYLDSDFADTVTVIRVPDGVTDEEILNDMMTKHGIIISGCFDVLKGKVVRIGHMGESCRVPLVRDTLRALQQVLESHGISLTCNLEEEFLAALKSC